MANPLKTPGVYISEQNAFPNSIIFPPSAVPVFLGYTKKARLEKQNLNQIPTRINSLIEFEQLFGGAPPAYFDIEATANAAQPFKLSWYSGRFLLYHSLKWFFINGGAECYILSVGNFQMPPKKSDFDGEDGVSGLAVLTQLEEPNLLVLPDAVLLPPADCAALQKQMLAHCQSMTNRFAILDVPMGDFLSTPTPTSQIITDFRSGIGTEFLKFGAAYFPYLFTNVAAADGVNFTQINPARVENLINILKAEVEHLAQNGVFTNEKAAAIKVEIQKIKALHRDFATEEDGPKKNLDSKNKPGTDIKSLHQTLMAVSPIYRQIMDQMLEQINLLPPSGAIAGIYAMVDATRGIFKAPANVQVAGTLRPSVVLSNEDQEFLNLPLDGKAVNAIRNFVGQGVLVWGARTLDGNSQDWRYVSVRRTVLLLEQTIKNACSAFVFSPNTAPTWIEVKSLIENFLIQFWRSGGLAGSTPKDAFAINIGLGYTMTQEDILNGIMRITIMLALVRPAEFINFTIEIRMVESG